MSTHGPAYDAGIDEPRLTNQRDSIREFMLKGGWHTLSEIEAALGYPQASISSQLRHLAKPQFGGYHKEKQRRCLPFGGEPTGTWEYKLSLPTPLGQGKLPF